MIDERGKRIAPQLKVMILTALEDLKSRGLNIDPNSTYMWTTKEVRFILMNAIQKLDEIRDYCEKRGRY